MHIIHAIILGIVEGITEFLPVSSTAHIALTASVFNIPETEFLKTFTVVIQFGAILAVCVLFFKRIREDRQLIRSTIVAFIPTALIGFVLYKIIKHYLIGNVALSGSTLLLGGLVFLWLEYVYLPRRTGTAIATLPNDKGSIGFGIAQALAVIPGVSRSGAVIVYGLLQGYSREVVTLFAFLLALPTMGAAACYDLYKSSPSLTPHEWMLIGIGSVVSFIVAYIVSRWFIKYIATHSFKLFGWYRVIAGIVILIFVL